MEIRYISDQKEKPFVQSSAAKGFDVEHSLQLTEEKHSFPPSSWNFAAALKYVKFGRSPGEEITIPRVKMVSWCVICWQSLQRTQLDRELADSTCPRRHEVPQTALSGWHCPHSAPNADGCQPRCIKFFYSYIMLHSPDLIWISGRIFIYEFCSWLHSRLAVNIIC